MLCVRNAKATDLAVIAPKRRARRLGVIDGFPLIVVIMAAPIQGIARNTCTAFSIGLTHEMAYRARGYKLATMVSPPRSRKSNQRNYAQGSRVYQTYSECLARETSKGNERSQLLHLSRLIYLRYNLLPVTLKGPSMRTRRVGKEVRKVCFVNYQGIAGFSRVKSLYLSNRDKSLSGTPSTRGIRR